MNSGISDNCKPFHSLLTGVGKTTIELNIAPVCVCVCKLHAILTLIRIEWKYPPYQKPNLNGPESKMHL